LLTLAGPAWSGCPVWIHADLLRPNLLVDGGRIRAVIDFGAAGRGDQAADVIPAWSVFGPVGRASFRARLDVDDDTRNRTSSRTTATATRPSPAPPGAPSPCGRRDRRRFRMTGQEGCARCIRTRSTPAASVVRPTTR
jgi:hypothetical protein